MAKTKNSLDKKKLLLALFIALIILIVVVIIVIDVRSERKKVTPKDLIEKQAIEVGTGTGAKTEDGVSPESQDGGEFAEGTGVNEINPALVGAIKEAPGANLISTDGQVITDEGEVIRTDVLPTDAQAPRSSLPITKEQVEEKAVMLDISTLGFSPNIFTVKTGEVVTIALTSTDEWSHNINFSDPILQAAETSVSAGTTRAFSFNAPSAKGEYNFFCSIPGHAARGEAGKMIVE